MEANVWFTNASLVVDTRLAFPEKKRKEKEKREEHRDDKVLAQGVFACICTNSV